MKSILNTINENNIASFVGHNFPTIATHDLEGNLSKLVVIADLNDSVDQEILTQPVNSFQLTYDFISGHYTVYVVGGSEVCKLPKALNEHLAIMIELERDYLTVVVTEELQTAMVIIC